MNKILTTSVFLLLCQTTPVMASPSCGLTKDTRLGEIGNKSIVDMPNYNSANIVNSVCSQAINLTDSNGSDWDFDCYIGYNSPHPYSSNNVRILAPKKGVSILRARYKSLTMYYYQGRYYTRIGKPIRCITGRKLKIEVF